MTILGPLTRPVVIIGAARSGTKILRDALASHPRLAAVPFDINYVWKFGHYDLDHDELTPAQLTPLARRYVRSYLRSFVRSRPPIRVIEKTVSNCLRVPFVREVLPDSQFIHLIRDGRDVAASARRMWRAPPDWSALALKVRSFPWLAVPSYGRQYTLSYLRRSLGKAGQVSSWGPRFRDMDDYRKSHTLLETCAMQWRRCVERATADLATMPDEDVITVRYEDLVSAPVDVLDRLMKFQGLDMAAEVTGYVAENIVSTSLGKWKAEIGFDEVEPMMAVLRPALTALGYGP